LVVGAAAAGRGGTAAKPGRAVWGAAFVLAVMVIRVVDRGVTPAVGWELRLAEAAERARPVAEVASRLSAAGAAGLDPAERNRLLREASEIAGAALGEAAARDGAELRRAVSRLEARRLIEAAEVLLSARPPAPDFATVREASRVLLRAAIAQRALGEAAAATRTAERAAAVVSGVETAQGLTWRAALLAAWAQAAGDVAARDAAIGALRRAKPLDPYNLASAWRLMELLEAAGDRPGAAEAAREVLRLDALQRLDRAVRGLTPERRARAENLAGTGGG